MGNSSSSNAVESMIDLAINVTNAYTSKCTNTSGNTSGINISGCEGVVVTNINQETNSDINLNCVQNVMTDSQIEADISQQLSQQATAITQSLGGLSKADANNFASAAIKLGIDIKNSYVSECLTTNANNSFVNCTDSQNVIISNIGQKATLKAVAQCAQQAQTKNQAKAVIQQTISQTAVAKEENSLTAIFGIVLVVLIIVLFAFTFLFS